MYTLLKTVNKLTGKVSYYIDNQEDVGFKRITKESYQLIEIMYKRWDCLHTKSDSNYVRSFKSVR